VTYSMEAQFLPADKIGRWETKASQIINNSIIAETVVINDPTLATVFQYK